MEKEKVLEFFERNRIIGEVRHNGFTIYKDKKIAFEAVLHSEAKVSYIDDATMLIKGVNHSNVILSEFVISIFMESGVFNISLI